MCLSTRELVLRCCADLAEQQAKVVGSSEHKYGELTLSVGYIKETGNVEVTIFQGHNLPVLDMIGVSQGVICDQVRFTKIWLCFQVLVTLTLN